MTDEYTTLALLLLRDGRRKIDLAEWLKLNAADLLRKVWQHPRARDLLAALLGYIHSVARRTKPKDLNEAIGSILDAEARTMSMTIAEQLIQQGRLEGKLDGERKGKLEGRREGELSQRQAIEDLCELLGIEVNEARRAQLAELDLAGLDAFRMALKQKRGWPDSPS
jgi:predicted transposase YdaD